MSPVGGPWAALAVLAGSLGPLPACSEPALAPPSAAGARAAQPSAANTALSAATPDLAGATQPLASATLRARIHANLPEMSFTLVADSPTEPGGLLSVRAIEVRRVGEADLLQRIAGLSTATPSSADAPGLEALDLDFDGYADLRLIASPPAGPNLPCLHWLYKPATGRFVSEPALDDIGGPRPDAARRELRADWRDGPTRTGSDFYAWRGGNPVLVRKEERQYSRPGSYTLKVSRVVNGVWRVVRTTTGRDP